MDESGQASAEFILLFGGIIVVVLLAIFMYRNYVNDLSGEIKSKEVAQFNEKIGEISDLFTWIAFLKRSKGQELKSDSIMILLEDRQNSR